MVFDICLDKDGIRTAGIFVEMANYYFRQQKTLTDHLNYLYSKLLFNSQFTKTNNSNEYSQIWILRY